MEFQNLKMVRLQGDMLVQKFVVRFTSLKIKMFKDKTSHNNFMIKKI